MILLTKAEKKGMVADLNANYGSHYNQVVLIFIFTRLHVGLLLPPDGYVSRVAKPIVHAGNSYRA